jgi:hypothetical protein
VTGLNEDTLAFIGRLCALLALQGIWQGCWRTIVQKKNGEYFGF